MVNFFACIENIAEPSLIFESVAYDLQILQGLQKTKDNSDSRKNYLSGDLFFVHFFCWILNHLFVRQRTE